MEIEKRFPFERARFTECFPVFPASTRCRWAEEIATEVGVGYLISLPSSERVISIEVSEKKLAVLFSVLFY